MRYARAAFLPDTFHEINGVAHTSRHFEAFSRRRQIPFLSIHCGPERQLKTDGNVTIMQLKRGPFSIGLDAHLDYDPFLLRYSEAVIAEIKRFGAELIHVTGPGDMGMLGWYAASRLRLPLVASWHTSLHEYSGKRLQRLLHFLPADLGQRAGTVAESLSLKMLEFFYRRAAFSLAPNQQLVEFVAEMTDRPVYLMKRGVDSELFSPERRNRSGRPFCLGYVGRLTAEKNVRFLVELANALKLLGRTDFQFVVVGEGREEDWLRQNLPDAIFTGVLRGARLAEAYANMDLFLFPSHTDTFGNVVLEALASGVPAVVTNGGGPKFLVQSGITGFVANSNRNFIQSVSEVMSNAALHGDLCAAARRYALEQSWDMVFEQVFRAYGDCYRTSKPVTHPAFHKA
jgi:phosphatidylinositol alpha 1,6-mannosyltransferase